MTTPSPLPASTPAALGPVALLTALTAQLAGAPATDPRHAARDLAAPRTVPDRVALATALLVVYDLLSDPPAAGEAVDLDARAAALAASSECGVEDALADLLHLANASGQGADAALETARAHVAAEWEEALEEARETAREDIAAEWDEAPQEAEGDAPEDATPDARAAQPHP